MKIKKSSLKKNILEYLLVIGGILILEDWMLGFHNIDFRVPIVADGGDGYALIASIKSIIARDGYRLGWPFATLEGQYDAVYNLLFVFLIRFLSLFTKNYYFIQNLYYFIIIFLNCFVSYTCFKQMRIGSIYSFFGSVLFGISPYVQFRISVHAALASVELIPVVFLMCFWLMEDDNYAVPSKGFFKNRKNVIQIFLSWCIANNGMIYYPFFACFLLLITGFYLALSKKQKSKMISAILLIGQIVIFLGLGFLPTLVGIIKGLGNVASRGAEYRDARRAVLYGLDFKSMFLSPKGFGISKLKDFYDCFLVLDTESSYAYVGVIGVLGIFILLVYLLINRNMNTLTEKRLKLLSVHCIFLILLCMRYGVGCLLALFIPMISCYNRVNPFLAFAGVLSFLIFMEEIQRNMQRRRGYLVQGIVLILLIFSIFEQQKTYYYLSSSISPANEEKVNREKKFFEEMEKVAGNGAKVFMLPYMRSFENGWLVDLYDYEHYRPYINTDSLYFCFGGINDGENDVWYKKTSQLEPSKMIDEIKDKGFDGIYINIKGYDGEVRKEYLETIIRQSGSNTVICDELEELWYIQIQ